MLHSVASYLVCTVYNVYMRSSALTRFGAIFFFKRKQFLLLSVCTPDDEAHSKWSVLTLKKVAPRAATSFLLTFNPKKATSADKISAKLFKTVKDTVVEPVKNLINLTITSSTFSNSAKKPRFLLYSKKMMPWSNQISVQSVFFQYHLRLLKKC